jgi:uncharacterized protein YndB with AHSA1/START domain
MAEIRHRVGITAPQTAVYERFATKDGLVSWWTEDVRGRSAPGDKLTFTFGSSDRSVTMEVIELTPNERVVWRCVEGPEQWVDGLLTFDVRAGDDETVLLFTHEGWREPDEFMHHCSTKWASFLIGLKIGMETGQTRAFPYDEKINHGD